MSREDSAPGRLSKGLHLGGSGATERLPVRRLRVGDKVSLVSPCSPPSNERLKVGAAMLADWGLVVDLQVPGGGAEVKRSAAERAAELQRALDDPECSGVLVTRAGSGAADVVSLVDFSVLEEQPKPFCGFSDVTVFHNALTDQTRRPGFHTPELAWNQRLNGLASAASLKSLLMGGGEALSSAGDGAARSWGPAVSGRLRGGNLSTLVRTDPPRHRSGDILFLEELRETPQAIDTMLRRLTETGHATGLAGVLLGQFVDCGEETELRAVLESWCATVTESVLSGVPVGHGHEQRSLPLAWMVDMDPRRGRVVWSCSPTSPDTKWN